ncbi:MAG: branched-chain amino acid ABC transporter permease [Bacillota bacterium]|nr:branched-chain amino acid ABC transporter permease [Bacillota bacterium]
MYSPGIILQQVSNFLQLGAIYALIALGYNMVYGILSLINFAHGQVFMVSAFIAYFISIWFGAQIPYPLGIGVTVLSTALIASGLGLGIERVAYRPLRNAPKMSALITAMSVSMFMENFTLAVVGPGRRQFPEALFPVVVISIGEVVLTNIQIIVILMGVVVMIGLRALVGGTQIGRAMRAVSVDLPTSKLMGINVDRIISFTFIVGSSLAALGGIMYGLAYPVIETNMGSMVGWKAFCAAVIGGIGSIEGSFVGALILGMVEIMVPYLLKSQFRDGIVFSLLIAMLIFRPMGIFGISKTQKV